MKILDVDFLTSVAAGGRLPPDLGPTVAMVGRSNVGKSRLINALARRRIARAGAKPGTTRLVNPTRYGPRPRRVRNRSGSRWPTFQAMASPEAEWTPGVSSTP